ncbi:hypothetical protein ACFL6S_24465 [Candidatus Poribacteria bacterium]
MNRNLVGACCARPGRIQYAPTDNGLNLLTKPLRRRLALRFVVCVLSCIILCLQIGCSFNKEGIQQADKSSASQGEKSGSLEEAAITQAASEKTLVSDNIRCITTGADSVWIGTDRGISIYHKTANQWTKLDREDGLISDDVTAIAVDGKSVWVGTRFGVSLYEREKDTWTKFQKRDGLADNRITSIAADGNYIWFGTESGVSCYNKATGAWSLQREKGKDKLNKITAIAVETEYVWFGTQEGLRRYDKAKNSWNTYAEKDGLIQNHISYVASSKDAIWVSTEKSGVSEYSKTNQAFIKSYTKNDFLESNLVKTVAVDGSNVWFGSADNGIRRYMTTVDTWFKFTTAQGLVSDHITHLTVDGNDVWIGTYEHGLCRYDKTNNNWTYYSKRDMLASNHVKSLFTTDEELWVGTTEGLSRYDTSEEAWTTYTKADGLVTNYITYITYDKRNETVWIGTPMGLGKLEPDTGDQASKRWRFYTRANRLAGNFVTCVNVSEDSVWAATRAGLSVLNAHGWHTYLKDKWVTSVLAIGSDVWAGTTDGLYRRDISKDQFDPLPSVTPYVNALAISKSGRLLVGTQEGLLTVDRVSLSVEHLQVEDGLPNPNVRAVAADGNHIWVGTPRGAARLTVEGNDIQISTMQQSGLLHDNIQSISAGRGEVFFGTVAGVAIYGKQEDQWKSHRPYYNTQVLRENDIGWLELDGDHLWAINWSASPNGAILKFDRRTDTWMKYTKENIPLSGEVPFITQVRRAAVDSDHVWFTTNGGVLRYTKKLDTWTHFTKSSGLPGHRALLVAADEPNYVWVIFHGGVASCYDKRTGKWETIQVTKAGVGTNIEAIAFTKKYVWFSTNSVGVRRYERESKKWTAYSEAQGMASRRGRWIVADGDDVWTGGWGTYSWLDGMGSGGMSRYHADDDAWSIYDKTKGLLSSGIHYGQVSKDYVWSFGYGGINRYDKAGATWISLTQSDGIPDHSVTAIVEDGKTLWIGTGSKGVSRYYEASGTWASFSTEDGLADNGVREYALKADSKYVWAGTSKGLSRYDKESEIWVSFTRPTTLANRRSLAVAADPRYVWVGTHRGLSRYDKRHDTWKHFQKEEERKRFPWESPRPEEKKEKRENELVDNNVVGLSVGERYVWIATEGGVGRYDKIADRFEGYTTENQLPSNDVRAIGESQGDVWICTRNGISRHNVLSDDKNAWETYNAAIEIQPMVMRKEYAKSLDNDDARCLAVAEDRVWVGTKTGVSAYDTKSDIWSTYTQKDGLISNQVSCIAVDNGSVWFGSGYGVTVYDARTGKWKTFTKDDGLPSNLITSIAVSKDQICFGTFARGVAIMDRAGEEFISLAKKDGLPHNGILSIAIDGGFIWLGTHSGLTRYDLLTQTWTIYTEGFDWDGL